jgi:hypothetical protein
MIALLVVLLAGASPAETGPPTTITEPSSPGGVHSDAGMVRPGAIGRTIPRRGSPGKDPPPVPDQSR